MENNCVNCSNWKKRTQLDKGVVGLCDESKEYQIMTYEYDTCDKFKEKENAKKNKAKRNNIRNV
jgi:hypothetical protein